jgi:hypothetical protein
MDTFTFDTLNKYIKGYKRDIVLKLANEKFTDKNISTQADLINMVLDYSPTIKSTIQYQDKINLSRLRSKPSIKKKTAQSIKLQEINESKEDEEVNSNSLKNSQKDENKNGSSISYTNNSLKDDGIKDHNTLRDSTILQKKNSFDTMRLIQKKQIRIYVLSTSNYFEIEFTPDETIFTLKKKILNKLKNAVNINLKHNLTDAYEIRSTKGMNTIFIKSKSKNEESKEKCEPDMDNPPIPDNSNIRGIDKDALCFIEKPGYASNRSCQTNVDSMIEDNKKVYGEIISDTGESKVNIKIYIKIDNNPSGFSNSKVVNLDSNMCLKDVFEKISNYASIKDKNSEYYYFVEHSDGRDNENMDDAINPDLEVKYLSPYILDLYKKKFADIPNVNRISSYSLNLNDEKKELSSNKNQDYVFNETTAGVYQEFSVIKINSHNKRQERILGIDLYNLKNEVPKSSGGIFSRRKAKIQQRKIKDIKEIISTGEKSFDIIVYEDNQTTKTLHYEATEVNKKNEIIAKLNYLIKMNNN